jgi:peptide-methionine (S)-S-oxide reductase
METLSAMGQPPRGGLTAPGLWLRDKIGGALDGFFKDPYLLWFVSEDAPVHGRLPKNIAEVTRAILRSAQGDGVPSLQEQLDYGLRLVSWSGVAQRCGVQIELLHVLLNAGASPNDASDNALVYGHLAAVEHLIGRGAKLTLATALCLGRWNDVSRASRWRLATGRSEWGLSSPRSTARPTRCGG